MVLVALAAYVSYQEAARGPVALPATLVHRSLVAGRASAAWLRRNVLSYVLGAPSSPSATLRFVHWLRSALGPRDPRSCVRTGHLSAEDVAAMRAAAEGPSWGLLQGPAPSVADEHGVWWRANASAPHTGRLVVVLDVLGGVAWTPYAAAGVWWDLSARLNVPVLALRVPGACSAVPPSTGSPPPASLLFFFSLQRRQRALPSAAGWRRLPRWCSWRRASPT